MMKFETLRVDDRFTLRPLLNSDAEALFELIEKNRARLREWLTWPEYSKSVSASATFIEQSQKDAENGSAYIFGAFLDEKLVGVADIHAVQKANRCGMIGYWMCESVAGQRLARRSSETLIRLGFLGNFNRIEIRCGKDNIRSRSIPEALGFQFEGVTREAEWLYDHFVDHNVYAMLRSDYERTGIT